MILTLRENFGIWSDLPVYAYSPRPGIRPSPWILDLYQKFAITPVFIDLNTDFQTYPLANKPLSMAHAEHSLNYSQLIFLDSDILCWQQPDKFLLPTDKEIGVMVDGTKTIASSGPNDKYENMWLRLYDIAGNKNHPYVTTLLTDEKVRGWWSSGVIVTRRTTGLMREWENVFRAAVAQSIFVPDACYLKEQASLCAVVASSHDTMIEFPVAYNYPVQNYAHYSSRGTIPEDAILWHYQPFLNKSFRKLKTKIDGEPTLLSKVELAEKFIHKLRTNYRSMIGLDESWLRATRRKLQIRNRIGYLRQKIRF